MSSRSTDIDSEGEDGSQSVVEEGDSQPSVEGGSQPKKGKKEVLQPLGTPKNKMTWKKSGSENQLDHCEGRFQQKARDGPKRCVQNGERATYVCAVV